MTPICRIAESGRCASLNQAKAQTDSARGHLGTQVATLRFNQDALEQNRLDRSV